MPGKKRYLFLIVTLMSAYLMNYGLPFFAEESEVIDEKIYTVEEIEVIEEAGTYPVRISYTNSETGVTVEDIIYLTVSHQRTIVNETLQEAIDAHDIEIKKGYFDKLSDQELMYLTNAKAWQLQNGQKIEIKNVDRDEKNADINRYKVTFSTEQGTNITVHVIESSEVIISKNEEYYSFLEFPYIFYFELALTIIIVFPLIALILSYWWMQREVGETEKVLYRKLNTEYEEE